MIFQKYYLEKCTYALDIQINWKPKQGDICFYTDKQPIFGIVCYDVKNKKLCFQKFDEPVNLFFDKQSYIFLPRQDQLQAMVNFDFVADIFEFKKWMINKINRNSKSSYCCPEEIWLEYVMEFKYKQIWSTNRWRKKKTK